MVPQRKLKCCLYPAATKQYELVPHFLLFWGPRDPAEGWAYIPTWGNEVVWPIAPLSWGMNQQGWGGSWTSIPLMCTEVLFVLGWYGQGLVGSWRYKHAQPLYYTPTKGLLDLKKDSPNIIDINVQNTTENYLSYQEPGKSQLKREKTIQRHWQWEVSRHWNYLKRILKQPSKNTPISNYEFSRNKWKLENLSKETGYEKQSNGNYRTGN